MLLVPCVLMKSKRGTSIVEKFPKPVVTNRETILSLAAAMGRPRV